MTNKQIILTMGQLPDGPADSNNKAVQLLNLQRQQLNSQSPSGLTRTSSSGADSADSAPSSVAPSPKALQQQQHLGQHSDAHQAAHSTGSSSTTSGYYAGSNSTGPASVDSDTTGGEGRSRKGESSSWRRLEGSRAKIALGSHANRSTPAGGQRREQTRGRFYLGQSNQEEAPKMEARNKCSPRPDEQQTNGPQSLKYVSFDV